MTRYQAQYRPDVDILELLGSVRGSAYDASSIDTMLDRLQTGSGKRQV